MSPRADAEKPARGVILRPEAVTAAGLATGVAYDPAGAALPIVSIRHEGMLVAEAPAWAFRPDLLNAGVSHGHHGFAARLRSALPAGPVSLALRIEGTAAEVTARLVVPTGVTASPVSVETLLMPPEAWTVSDLLARPDCLPWAEHLERLGAARFVDAAYRFTLARWPSRAEAAFHAGALSRGTVSAPAFLVGLLQSRERGDMPPALMSPFDPDFGFRLSPAMPGRGAAATAAPHRAIEAARVRRGHAPAK